jgi:two-component system, OmpR family, osmolarity sensor histidine kinase EnvZ
LGKATTYAASVNGQPGLWISFPIESDEYWLQLPTNRFDRVENSTWALWAAGAFALSVIGAVAITSFINRPLKQLSYAASRIREGDFSQELGEESGTEEIRALNRGFNRMARSLEKIDQDRSVMLAGISHDLRTPLTRLRLETELSVTDSVSREHMIKDIEQVDEIIGKFLEYARPATADAETLSLRTLIENVESAYRGDDEIRLYVKRNYNAQIYADPVELKRVLVNLIENSRRYGRSLSSNCAEIDISVRATNSRVQIDIRDHGPGVPEEHLGSLTRPFFRGDAARTEVKGTGLGLAIVEKIIERMQGRLTLSNADGGGLLARIELKRV